VYITYVYNRVTVAAPNILRSCSTKFTSNSQLTVSWPETRGATQFYVDVYDVTSDDRVYNVNVLVTDVLLTKLELNMQYAFYVTGLGSKNQRGNTVSCIGSTGT